MTEEDKILFDPIDKTGTEKRDRLNTFQFRPSQAAINATNDIRTSQKVELASQAIKSLSEGIGAFAGAPVARREDKFSLANLDAYRNQVARNQAEEGQIQGMKFQRATTEAQMEQTADQFNKQIGFQKAMEEYRGRVRERMNAANNKSLEDREAIRSKFDLEQEKARQAGMTRREIIKAQKDAESMTDQQLLSMWDKTPRLADEFFDEVEGAMGETIKQPKKFGQLTDDEKKLAKQIVQYEASHMQRKGGSYTKEPEALQKLPSVGEKFEYADGKQYQMHINADEGGRRYLYNSEEDYWLYEDANSPGKFYYVE